ncbi:hypothetical protein FB45DRAFT_1005212 [Roridomyces roridus]|uniref:F-box domain-containing protein n=1 Tax=Roridomyces roridus TaxID=1738132 RepID=A0AAD7FL04_9AGAR|nr:hypothetical protein FB45DRAFT_1005212 [Roridomyces roridus]
MSDLDIEWALSAARGNLVPSYEQRESIQRAVAQLQHRLESQQDLENTEVDDLPRQIAVFSSLLAHIRRLPPEILGTIMSDLDIEWALSAARENLIPSDEQRASIEQAVAQLQHHLESQEDFENTHDLRRQIAVFSSLLAPIRRLPPEILSQIWIQPSLDTPAPRSSYIRLPRFSGRGTNPVPAVSFHWRAIAVSTPKFWASFYVDLLGTDNTARLLELYLERHFEFVSDLGSLAPTHKYQNVFNFLNPRFALSKSGAEFGMFHLIRVFDSKLCKEAKTIKLEDKPSPWKPAAEQEHWKAKTHTESTELRYIRRRRAGSAYDEDDKTSIDISDLGGGRIHPSILKQLIQLGKMALDSVVSWFFSPVVVLANPGTFAGPRDLGSHCRSAVDMAQIDTVLNPMLSNHPPHRWFSLRAGKVIHGKEESSKAPVRFGIRDFAHASGSVYKTGEWSARSLVRFGDRHLDVFLKVALEPIAILVP